MKLKSALLASVLPVALAIAAAAPALAQTPMPDPLDDRSAKRIEKMEKVVRELRAIVFQGRDTGKPVVVQTAETDAQIAALNDRITDLEQTIQRMNGQNETLTHDIDVARRASDGQKARADQLEQRLAALEGKITTLEAAAATAAAAQIPPPPPPPPADPATAFKQARQLLLDGDYTGAENAFGGFVSAYPDDAKAPEARYWLGETQFVREAYGDAAGSYLGAVRGWPQTSWAPNAVLKLSRSLIALKKPADACRTLDELTKRYPKAPADVVSKAKSTRVQAKCAA
ncbi:tol-pal system protein YbgF [Caulobacter sp. D4A]|uniref:tol-pal system protein YbgF n=1 Tax=unclassified Caulobacter TaxID=2648921 RepID=UPI000D734E33|nr:MULTISPECIES: tol-pal system protein YbgF [unclassified Caulobacter]PXA84443.1 tol-pal system protein YbgF [Caulobacter sp. D5]PXA92099.1 tol-pal system protein YbgF [Caulobacter sp. D4A]